MGVVGSRHTSYFGHRNSPKINSGRRNGGCRTFTAIRKKSKVGRRNGSHDFQTTNKIHDSEWRYFRVALVFSEMEERLVIPGADQEFFQRGVQD